MAIRRWFLYVFSAAHGLHDLFTGVWVLVLAAQVSRLDMSYTEAGIAQAAYTIVSAIAQPMFGGWFDRSGKPYLALWSVAGTTFFVALGAWASSPFLLSLAGMGAGLGSAAFHAAGLSGAKHLAAGRGHGRATAIFLLGGNGGFAIGAYMGGVIADRYGLSWLTLPAVLVIFCAPILVRILRPVLENLANEPERPTREYLNGGRKVWIPILAFVVVVTANQFFQGGYATYLPQFYESQGNNLEYAGLFTSIFLFFAAIGSFVGGSLADRFPRRMVAISAMILMFPLSYVVLQTQNAFWLTFFSIILGLCTNMSLPILLLIGQEVLPGGRSAASGYAFGITFLSRGLTTPLVGALADYFTLQDALFLVGAIPLIGALFMLLLPPKSP